MPSIEWSTSEIMQVTNELANRNERSLAQLSRDLSTTLGRPYSGVYSKVRELVNNNENDTPQVIEVSAIPEQTESVASPTDEDGRSLLTYMIDKIHYYETKANELRSLLQEYQQAIH